MNNYLLAIDIIGISAFTISGYIIAIKNRLDLLGIFLISFVTALGGGIIRDMILNKTPFTFSSSYPAITVFSVLIISYMLKLGKIEEETLYHNKLYNISDSLGLVFFSILGANLAIANNFNFLGVVLLGLLTATGGGIIRDISLNKIPSIFNEGFYGSISVILGILIYIENILKNDISLYINFNYIMILNLLIGISIRYYVLKNEINVPKLKVKEKN